MDKLSIFNQRNHIFLFIFMDVYQLEPAKDSLTVLLSDGRKLGYTEYGNKDGFPVLYFHGFPGSRIEGKLIDINLNNDYLRVISVDRPGIGISSPKKHRTLLDWPDDVQELLEYLHIDQYSILAISGGAPYAFACLNSGDPKLISVTVVSGMGPVSLGKKAMTWYFRLGLNASKYAPWLMFAFMKIFVQPFFKKSKRTEWMLRRFTKFLPPVDRELFSDAESFEIFAADTYYAFVQGILGSYQDLMIYARDWGFDLNQLPSNIPVYLIHGQLDDTVPIEMAKQVSERLPLCKLWFYENEGHYSTPMNKLPSLIDELLPEFIKTQS